MDFNMATARWLIEKDVFEDNHDKLVEEIKRQGMEAKIVPYIPFEEKIVEKCLKVYGPDECVIFYGSLNFGRKLRKGPWVPGVYLNERAFECTSYYPALGHKLIHSNYIMMPYGDLIRRKWDLYYLLKDDKLFIRPNSGNKEFTGMVVEKNNFEDCIKLAGFYDVDPDLLVVVSNVHPLLKEWRFVIVDKQVISGSLYRQWGKAETLRAGTVTRDFVLKYSHSTHEECNDAKAWEAAQRCAETYNPDKCYTIDVAMTEMGTYGILEVGCFSCAGLYGNDLAAVVSKVSEAAEKEWNEYRNEI
jgi:hypothetical protein